MESRVLIAEDDSLVARALQQALVKAGYGVDVVADGMAARERLLTGAYGALVTDWMMPELDGIELVRLVRARRQPACVVLITELNIPAAQSHALQQGADDFFTKPVLANDVVRSVTRWFATRAANDTAKRGVVTPIEASVANDSRASGRQDCCVGQASICHLPGALGHGPGSVRRGRRVDARARPGSRERACDGRRRAPARALCHDRGAPHFGPRHGARDARGD